MGYLAGEPGSLTFGDGIVEVEPEQIGIVIRALDNEACQHSAAGRRVGPLVRLPGR